MVSAPFYLTLYQLITGYQPVIVQYMKYLYPRGLEKNPCTLLLIM